MFIITVTSREGWLRLGGSLPPLGKPLVAVWKLWKREPGSEERVNRRAAQTSPAPTCRCRVGIQFAVFFGRVTPHSGRTLLDYFYSMNDKKLFFKAGFV